MQRAGASGAIASLAISATIIFTPTSARADASLVTTDGGLIREAAHTIEIEIAGTVASVTSKLTILNPGRAARQAIYSFELPDNAAVLGMTVELPDGRTTQSEIVDAAAAVHIAPGGEVLAERGAAADAGLLRLVERDRQRDPSAPGRATYELQLYPIPPGRTTQVAIRWVAPTRLDDGRLSLRIPGRGEAANLVTEQVAVEFRAGRGIKGYRQLFAGDRLLAPRSTGKRFKTLAPRRGDLVIEAEPELPTGGGIALSYAAVPIDGTLGAVAVQAWAPRPAGKSALDHDRVVLVVDRSASLDAAGHRGAATTVSTLLDAMPEETVVELISFDRTASRLFAEFKANSHATRKEIATALAAAPMATNGSDLGAALDLVNRAVEREEDKRGRGSTLVAIISDGMTPLHLDGRQAADRIGEIVLARGQVLAVTLVPDQLPAPDTSAGPMADLAARTGGRSIAIRHGQVADRAQTLAAELARPSPLERLALTAGKGTEIVGATLPRTLEAGRGLFAVAFYRGKAPRSLTLTGLSGGKRTAIRGTADGKLGRSALALALIGTDPLELRDALAGADGPADDVRATWLAAARKAGTVTSESAIVAVDPKDGFARDRLAMTRKWGPSVYMRMPTPDEQDGRDNFRPFQARTGAPTGADGDGPAPTGTLDRRIIARLIKTHVIPKARACYEKALARNPQLAGALVLYLELARGEVQWAEVQRSTFPGAVIEKCVADAGFTIRVPQVALGAADDEIGVVRYPLAFSRRKNGTSVRPSSTPPPVTVDPNAPL